MYFQNYDFLIGWQEDSRRSFFYSENPGKPALNQLDSRVFCKNAMWENKFIWYFFDFQQLCLPYRIDPPFDGWPNFENSLFPSVRKHSHLPIHFARSEPQFGQIGKMPRHVVSPDQGSNG